MKTYKQISAAAIIALVAATSVSAATNDSVLAKISDRNKASVSYTLAGKNQGESGFRNGILPSAIGKKVQTEQRAVEYKVRYQTPVASVPARSEFRNHILSSAKGKATKNTAEIASFQLKDK